MYKKRPVEKWNKQNKHVSSSLEKGNKTYSHTIFTFRI